MAKQNATENSKRWMVDFRWLFRIGAQHPIAEPNTMMPMRSRLGDYNMDFVTFDVAEIYAGFGAELSGGMSCTSCLENCNATWIGTTGDGMFSTETLVEEDRSPSFESCGRIGTCWLQHQARLVVASLHETTTSSIFCATSWMASSCASTSRLCLTCLSSYPLTSLCIALLLCMSCWWLLRKRRTRNLKLVSHLSPRRIGLRWNGGLRQRLGVQATVQGIPHAGHAVPGQWNEC